ncbi:hypothetical protein CCMA1212_005404 [Trichoderma ghanense]|uniref:Heterokaryon incompatibility domain-containing protein n=1 Tax=Trichoderma ghanense TaxID=65468 RepID=A0ABY2H2Y4_9HYPO
MSSVAQIGFKRPPPILSLLYGTRTQPPGSRIYKPLPPRTIRLLKLLPSNDADPIIALWLEHIPLEDAGPYDVLSYAWGDAVKDKDDKVILLNGMSIRVTTSLFNTLRRLRDTRVVQAFWIDALCVDQMDLADRRQHIGLIPSIYTRAEEVVMWSGERGDVNRGMLFKRAMARREAARHKTLLERPLEKVPVALCGEGEEVVGLWERGRGDLEKRLGGPGVDDVCSEA